MSYLSVIEESIGHGWLCARIFSDRLQGTVPPALCPTLLEQQLRQQPGVQRVRIEHGRVEVDYDVRQWGRREWEKTLARLQEA